MKCKDCRFFQIVQPPMMPFDSGVAKCDKHNLVVNFASNRKINLLECVEKNSGGQNDSD